jgi:prepilin signal peptidase PulO-like enzyme (type II secretory pathway)
MVLYYRVIKNKRFKETKKERINIISFMLPLVVLVSFAVCIMVVVPPYGSFSNRGIAICVVLFFIMIYISFLVANKAGI